VTRILLCLVVVACGRTHDFVADVHDAQPDSPPCTLVTCASQSATCGLIGDGCDGVVDCGSCTPPDHCGGDGTLFVCGGGTGSGACIPHTCAGVECGAISDGCGGVTADCGTCPTGQLCGVGGVPNVCVTPPCTGLCLQQNACANQPKTTVTGTVTAPGHATTVPWGNPDPIYGAIVYVPNGAAGPPTYGVTAFPSGVACDTCSTLVSGSPIVVSTATAVDGTFTLTDVPCGTNIPLVIQLGRWRREITIPNVPCCAHTSLTNAQTHLPRSSVGEPGDVRSDIPLMAFSTGNVDTLHCVLRKIGIDDSEFTNPSGPGRVRLYRDNGARIDANTPLASTLYGSSTELAKYDLALFECAGGREVKGAADQQRVIDFANAGGRVFATHYGYVWLTDSIGTAISNIGPKPFSQTATWLVDQLGPDAATAVVDQTLQGDAATQARRTAFASWLQLVGASTTLGQIPITSARRDFDAVSSIPATAAGTPAQRWLYSSTSPLHYTFDTPIAYPPNLHPTKQCGRVLYSDFHVSDAVSVGTTFPAECFDGPMTPQERALEFMLFDLASCIGPLPGACVPRTCEDQGFNCGLAGDGCDDGVVLHCGGCPAEQVCGGGDVSGGGTCGTGLCKPRTCADVGATCGKIGDGCGALVDCGTCDSGLHCGGGGVANQCGGLF